jgi:hypothetical protein
LVRNGEMDDDIRSFGETLGRRVLAREWAAARELLAPWLQATPSADDVRAFFENEYRSTLEANGVQELDHPGYPEPSVDAWQPILDGGGFLWGAFEDEALVGFAVLQPHLRPEMANLAVLHVSSSSRRSHTPSYCAPSPTTST